MGMHNAIKYEKTGNICIKKAKTEKYLILQVFFNQNIAAWFKLVIESWRKYFKNVIIYFAFEVLIAQLLILDFVILHCFINFKAT